MLIEIKSDEMSHSFSRCSNLEANPQSQNSHTKSDRVSSGFQLSMV